MKIPTTLLFTFILLSHAAFAGAQARPDVTGTWKMNSSKSHFGGHGPTSITIKFVQKDSTLLESLTLGGDDGEHSLDLKYTTDGKEGVNQIGDEAAKTIAAWEKDALVIEWKGDGRSLRRKITLSADGKTMTIAVHHPDSGGGEVDDTVVLEKQ